MRHRTAGLVALLVFTLPAWACNVNTLTAWGDLAATAGAIWSAIWATPEPDYYAVSLFCSEGLKEAHGDPPQPYVDAIAATTQEIAAAWGISPPFSETLTVGDSFPKPDGCESLFSSSPPQYHRRNESASESSLSSVSL